MHKVAFLVAVMAPMMAFAADHGKTEQTIKQRSVAPVEKQAEQFSPEGEFPVVVPPEVSTTIRLSSSDLNRISCPAEIKEALTSTEKGVTIKITGKDAFVKFKVTKRGDKMVYSSTPTEVYVVCGDETYSMIAFPQRIPSQTIRLSSGKEKKIKENISLYSGLPFEKKLLKVIREVFTEQIPDSYTVTREVKRFDAYKEIRVTLRRTVDIEGEGLRVKEYEVALKEGILQFKMNEKMFIRTELAENPVAVSLERHLLRVGDTSRLFVVEQRAARQGMKRLDGELPVMDPRHSEAHPPQKKGQEHEAGFKGQEADDEK